MEEYKSPPSRLIRILKKSRETWKAKAATKQNTIRRLMGAVQDKAASRDYWKRKAKELEKALREAQIELAEGKKTIMEAGLGESVEGFKGLPLCPDMERSILNPPKGHTYPVFTIQLAIQGVIDALMSLRGAERCFELFSAIFTMPTPSFSSVRNWVFRMGLFDLQREREYRSDWIYILDMSVERGQCKCLVVLGIAQARLLELKQQEGTRNGLALTHRDVDVLDLHVAAHFTGEVVDQRLEMLSHRVGDPIQIVSDHGSDVKKGIEIFVEKHSRTIYTYDITHQLALFVKAALVNDECYQSFCRRCTQAAPQVQQTELYFLIPPAQRTKGRYLNVDRYVKWAGEIVDYEARGDFSAIGSTFVIDVQTILTLINQLDIDMFIRIFHMDWMEYSDEETFVNVVIEQIGQEGFDQKGAEICWAADVGRRRFEEKLGWVTQFQEDIEIYAQMVELVKTAEEQVKRGGLHEESSRDFEKTVKDMTIRPRLQQLKDLIVAYLSDEGRKIPRGQVLLGTSDVLESLFGKYKLFSHGPFKEIGKMLLTLPLCTARITGDFVKEAMEKVGASDVEEWAERVFGQSALSKRRLAFNPQDATQK